MTAASAFPTDPRCSRRSLGLRVSTLLPAAALCSLQGYERPAQGATAPTGTNPLAPRPTRLVPRARAVIQLFMNGGPSQMDLFDPKPELDAHHGEPYFPKIAGEVENVKDAGALMRSPFRFAQYGDCGMWVSNAMPAIAGQVDKLALIRSLHTTNITHEPALYLAHSGRMISGHPSLGSWVTWGLGSENQNLPAYVVLDDPLGLPINGVENWSAGYLPANFQGTRFRSQGSAVLNLRPAQPEPEGIAPVRSRLRAALDDLHRRERPGHGQLSARIASYELAARMQLSAGEALDLTQETAATQGLYGIGQEPTDSYGRRCLIARRLVERGVRFVQLYINAQIWDNHTGLATDMKGACDRTDRPIAGLLTDLEQRGLLDDTLVVWGGEFGRLPIAQLPPDTDERKAGRDHNKNAGVCWFAGGGVQGGVTHGVTDELGFAAVADRVSIPDWHATILHLMGLDHLTLAVDHGGLQERLTGVEPARVVTEILASSTSRAPSAVVDADRVDPVR
ncbi:MAG: DUF1501 domain-containing protein [Planctomycetaceae bacterium]